MRNSFAYHVTAHALEARSGVKPIDRFVLAASHALVGHVPFSRCVAAAEARRREGASSGAIERSVAEWIAADINPVVQAAKSLRSARAVVAAYNAYNRSAQLAIRTEVALGEAERGATRALVGAQEDPEASRVAALAILDRLAAEAVANGEIDAAPPLRKLSDVARHLGVEGSAAAEASMVLEASAPSSVQELARALGCSPRTLERRLRQEGASPELLKRAARILRATEMLRGSLSLTDIAHEVGFSDLSHMSRGFQASCGMSPSLLRAILLGKL